MEGDGEVNDSPDLLSSLPVSPSALPISGIIRHPSGLSYVNVSDLGRETADAVRLLMNRTRTQQESPLLYAATVQKVGRYPIAKKRVLLVGPEAVYQAEAGLARFNRFIPIREISCLYTKRKEWFGIECPTQYDTLVNPPNDETFDHLLRTITKLHAYLNRHKPNAKALRVVEVSDNIRDHLRLSKPADWALTQEKISITKPGSRKQIQDKHAKQEEEAGGKPAAPTAQRAQLTMVTSSYEIEPEEDFSDDDFPRRGSMSDTMPESRAQFEAEVEGALLRASEWERKATVLKVRETQLEQTHRELKGALQRSEATVAQLTQELSQGESAAARMTLENTEMRKERERACEGLKIDPLGDVSLTEAARRLAAVHDSLTDDNWRLTKEIAGLEKRLAEVLDTSKLGREKAKLEADVDALRLLVEARAVEGQGQDRSKQDTKQIAALTRQLHAERQGHEETKLKHFELVQKHGTLETRFKEHSTTSRGATKAAEKKLKSALQQKQQLQQQVDVFTEHLHINGEHSVIEAAVRAATPDPNTTTATTSEPMPTNRPRFVVGGPATSQALSTDTCQHAGNHHTSDVAIGAKVILRRGGANKENDGGAVPCRGVVQYVGRLAGHAGEWIGVELDDVTPGGHAGTLHGKRYFECPAGRGLFIRPALVAVEGFACRRCTAKQMRPSTPQPPSRSRSRTPSKSPEPPTYQKEEDYLGLCISLRERLESAEGKLSRAEGKGVGGGGGVGMGAKGQMVRVPSPSPKVQPSPATPPPEYHSGVGGGGGVHPVQVPGLSPSGPRRGRSRSASPGVCIKGFQ